MNTVEKIKCPNCHTEIDVNKVLSNEIEAKIITEKEKEFTERLKIELDKKSKEINVENKEAIETLQKSLKEKTEQVIELNKTKSELEKLKMEKDEIASKITAEKDAEIAQKLKSERESQKVFYQSEIERAKKEALDENNLKLEELKKKLEDQTALAEEMKRKAEQGSMQLQGEVQELAIEDVLKDAFPFDIIEPVPKGVRGADVIQKVRNNIGNEVGIIAYESKRTKTYSNDWISKLKEDGRLVNADILVLVTDKLPDDIDRLGQKDGVWICTFSEFKSLALILRDSLIKIKEAFSSQTNKGDKMHMLYDYLTGKEFNAQISGVLESFDELRKGYIEERSKMERIWKTREKQLEKIMLNANGFIGSIQGIAGGSIPEIPMIEDN